MTDALHDKLADALRDVSPHAPWVLSGKILEALAAYWAAKKEPAKLVKLPKVTRCIETWSDYRDEVIAALKAHGIDVEQ